MSGRNEDKTGKEPFSLRHLFAATHRGILFDIIIFLVSVFLMRILVGNFAQIVSDADRGDSSAIAVMGLYCLGLLVLPPVAAILKRCQFHQRLQERGKNIHDEKNGFVFGCLFNPIFFFCLTIVVISGLNACLMQLIYQNKEPGEGVFVSLTFGGLAFAILQTYLVYHFFSPPKREPRWRFLADPRAALIGDICILVNMILFQVLWGSVWGAMGFGRITDVEDFFGRFFLIGFLALLLYFPPRVLFLAEDIRRPLTWFTILLANSPMIVRVVFGI